MAEHSETALEDYQRDVAAITARFAECSHRIRAIEWRLKDEFTELAPAVSIAKSIRVIQDHEREKLQLTAALQMARQRHSAAQTISEQEEEKLPEVTMHATRLKEEIEELSTKLEAAIEAINDASGEISSDLADILDAEDALTE